MSNYFFAFEADFVDSLRCIPMRVRMNLDTCGIKLKLTHWHCLEGCYRHDLVTTRCTTSTEIAAYGELVKELVAAKTAEPLKELPIDSDPAWLNLESIPSEVLEQAQNFGIVINQHQWQGLSPLKRFALIKLSRPGHENKNFFPALQEFGLE